MAEPKNYLSPQEKLKQHYKDQAKKGAKAVTKGADKFVKDYIEPTAKFAGSFSPMGPVIGLTDAYNSYKKGDSTSAVIGAGMEVLPFTGKYIVKGVKNTLPFLKKTPINKIPNVARKESISADNVILHSIDPEDKIPTLPPIDPTMDKKIEDVGGLAREFVNQWAYKPNAKELNEKFWINDERITNLIQARNKTEFLTDKYNKINKLIAKGVDTINDIDVVDPTFKNKISALYKEAGKSPRLGNSVDIDYLQTPDNNKAVFLNRDHKSYKSLTNNDKDYIERNIERINGYNTGPNSVTFASKPQLSPDEIVIPNPEYTKLNMFQKLLNNKIPKQRTEHVYRASNRYRNPESMSGTMVHEGGHAIQNIHRWGDLIVEDVPEYKYYTSRTDNPLALKFKSELVDPVSHPDKPTPETWLSSGMELHSELMRERFEHAKRLMKSEQMSLNDAVKYLKETDHSEDYLKSPEISRFFKTNNIEKQKELLRMLPALGGVGYGLNKMANNKDTK